MKLTKAPLTLALIITCVAVWAFEMLDRSLLEQLALIPALGATEPWRWLTSAFTHDDGFPMHVVSNMVALWMIGSGLEPFLGRRRYLAIYLLSAFGGSVAFVMVSFPPSASNPLGVNWDAALVGASGAVFGLFGALLIIQWRLKQSTRQLWLVVGINAVITFTIPGIAWQAHIGGFVVGAAVTWLMWRQLVKAKNAQLNQLRQQALALGHDPHQPVVIHPGQLATVRPTTWPIELGVFAVLTAMVAIKYLTLG